MARRFLVPALLLLAATLFAVAALNGGGRTGHVAAASTTSAHLELLVPGDEGWIPVDVQMLVLVEPGASADEAVAIAREGILASVPFAVEQQGGEVSAQFAAAGWTWPDGVATWSYNPSGAPAGITVETFVTAAETWNAAGSNFRFERGDNTSATPGLCTQDGMDGKNTVGWVDSLPGTTLAMTCTRYPEGVATESDVQFDRTRPWTTSTNNVDLDLPSVALHEFGHILGLKHSTASRAVMHGTYWAGELKRELQTDDLAGLHAIYGGAPAPTATPTPTSVPPTPAPTSEPGPSGAQAPVDIDPLFVPGLRANW